MGVSDEVLVTRARNGDREAMNQILDRYKEKVRGVAKTLFLIGGDRDDLIQEGMIGLFSAVTDYDEGEKASFATFADMCIRRQMYKAVESRNRMKNRPLNEYISFYAPASSETDDVSVIDTIRDDDSANPEVSVIAEENAKDLMARLRETLTPLEEKVFDLYISDYGNNAEMAAVIGKNEKAVDNAISRIKKKTKIIIEEQELERKHQ